jgi:methyl-accepting chemotaxis protein
MEAVLVPRVSTVEKHPKRLEIEKAIIDGVSYRKIAARYKITQPSVYRYIQAHLVPKLVGAIKKQEEQEGQDLLARIEKIIKRLQKLYDACDEYLKDPENPDRYELGPRSWEIDVIYRTVEPDTDKMIVRKESLQSLLEKIDREGYQPWEVKFKQADPRKLLIDNANSLNRQLETIARLHGHIKDTVQQVTVNNYWGDIQAVIIGATEGYPEVREKIINGIEQTAAKTGQTA